MTSVEDGSGIGIGVRREGIRITNNGKGMERRYDNKRQSIGVVDEYKNVRNEMEKERGAINERSENRRMIELDSEERPLYMRRSKGDTSLTNPKVAPK